ncbi:MAG: hypothetical protein U1E29_06995, partial [Coriobacteriia bacterium]|nr:hypothetical protein [Coriobacteriia bacterium]
RGAVLVSEEGAGVWESTFDEGAGVVGAAAGAGVSVDSGAAKTGTAPRRATVRNTAIRRAPMVVLFLMPPVLRAS